MAHGNYGPIPRIGPGGWIGSFFRKRPMHQTIAMAHKALFAINGRYPSKPGNLNDPNSTSGSNGAVSIGSRNDATLPATLLGCASKRDMVAPIEYTKQATVADRCMAAITLKAKHRFR